MSKIALSGDASGTGTFTLASPNSSTDRTLTLPDESGTVLTSGGAIDVNASAPADSVVINSNGNVGIGTSSFLSGAKFQVKTATDKNLFIGSNSVGYLNDAGSSWVQTDVKGSTITFGTGQFATEAARITSGGQVFVGCTTAPSASVFGIQLSPVLTSDFSKSSANSTGDIRHWGFYNTNGLVGGINTNGSATSYNTSSDYRLKENIAPMTGALTKILALNPVTYTWKVDGSAGEGFIAHELQAVIPDAVTGEKDAVETYTDEEGIEQTRPVYQGVDTSFLVATLTAAIQELKAELDIVKAEVEALKGQA